MAIEAKTELHIDGSLTNKQIDKLETIRNKLLSFRMEIKDRNTWARDRFDTALQILDDVYAHLGT